MSRKENADQMLEMVNAWRTSGLTQVEFAKVHGIKLHKFRYWVSRWRAPGESGFIELGTMPPIPVSLRYPNGVELHLAPGTPVSFIKELIQI